MVENVRQMLKCLYLKLIIGKPLSFWFHCSHNKYVKLQEKITKVNRGNGLQIAFNYFSDFMDVGCAWKWGCVSVRFGVIFLQWFLENCMEVCWKMCLNLTIFYTISANIYTEKSVAVKNFRRIHGALYVFGIQKVKLSLYTWNENEIYGSWYLESIWNSLYQIVFGIFYHFRYTFQLFPIIGACVCLCDVGIISFFEHFIWIHF